MKALLMAAALAIPFAASAADPPPTASEPTPPPSDMPKSKEAGIEPAPTEVFSAATAANKLNKISKKNIELGTLGEARASSEDVRKLGSRIVKDQTQLGSEVSSFAKKQGITLSEVEGSAVKPGGAMGGSGSEESMAGTDPATIGQVPAEGASDWTAKLDELRSLTGTEFDSKLLSNVVDSSQQSITKLQGYKGKGDKELDKLIDKSVKVLGNHQKEATKLQQKIPAA